MRHKRVEFYLHFVWATYERRPLITPDIEPRLYRNMAAQVKKQDCHLLAIGGLADHVHLVLCPPVTVHIPSLVQRVKGVSSAFVRDLWGPERFFRWQAGYGLFSFHYLQRDKVIAYVRNQKQRHAEGRVWPDWEEPDADDLPAEPDATDDTE